MKAGSPSTQVLVLLAVVLPAFAALSTGAGFGCSEGACGILASLLGALWVPIVGAWLVVVVLLLGRALEK